MSEIKGVRRWREDHWVVSDTRITVNYGENYVSVDDLDEYKYSTAHMRVVAAAILEACNALDAYEPGGAGECGECTYFVGNKRNKYGVCDFGHGFHRQGDSCPDYKRRGY